MDLQDKIAELGDAGDTAEMGDLMEGEDPFLLPGKKARRNPDERPAPSKDETLYDL